MQNIPDRAYSYSGSSIFRCCIFWSRIFSVPF